MKKCFLLFLTLALVLFFTGCATTSDAGESDETSTLSWNDASSKAGTPDAPVPYSSAAPASPKQKKNLTLDEIFDGTTKWPENAESLPVEMKTAKDADMWDSFRDMMMTESASIEELEKYLLGWYDKYGWTPEFYAACHNFYYQKALTLLNTAASEDDIDTVYKNLDRCFDSCYHGSMQYPERLDLWCGYVHAAIMLGDYDSAEGCIQAIFDRLEFNGNTWYWTYNEPFYDGEEEREKEFVQIMHDYIAEFLEANILDYAYSVSSRLLDCFPDNVVAMNDMALTWLYAGDFEEACPYLERAMELDPTDMIVVMNLAYVYNGLGRYEESFELANKMILSGEEDYVSCGILLTAELNSRMNPDK